MVLGMYFFKASSWLPCWGESEMKVAPAVRMELTPRGEETRSAPMTPSTVRQLGELATDSNRQNY